MKLLPFASSELITMFFRGWQPLLITDQRESKLNSAARVVVFFQYMLRS